MEKIKNHLKNFLESKKFNAVAYGFLFAVIALLIFQAGVFVGFHKASFSSRQGDNFRNNFGPRPNKMMGINPGMAEFPNPHGVSGKIISISLPSIMIEGQDNVEKVIVINKDTFIKNLRDTVSANELKINDSVVVVGNPNEKAEIEAKLIRIMPKDINPIDSINLNEQNLNK